MFLKLKDKAGAGRHCFFGFSSRPKIRTQTLFYLALSFRRMFLPPQKLSAFRSLLSNTKRKEHSSSSNASSGPIGNADICKIPDDTRCIFDRNDGAHDTPDAAELHCFCAAIWAGFGLYRHVYLRPSAVRIRFHSVKSQLRTSSEVGPYYRNLGQ